MAKFAQILDRVLYEDSSDDYSSAVAIVQHGNRWLLGLSLSAGDRRLKWVHPGGMIDDGETPQEAAVREAWEETGVRCKAVGEPFSLPSHKKVAFVHCRTTAQNPKLDNNEEFAALGFFTIGELDGLKLYKNVRNLINRVK